MIDGLTGPQRVFQNWALIWRIKTRPELALQLLSVDPHAPPEFRANIVRNLDEFHAAYATAPERRALARPRGPRPHLVTSERARLRHGSRARSRCSAEVSRAGAAVTWR